MEEEKVNINSDDNILIRCDVRCTGIFVIQSLPTTEWETGKELYDDIIKRFSDLKGFDSHFNSVYNRLEFLQLMDNIVDAVQNNRHYPILHFEIHGQEEGLGLVLASNELVTWGELAAHCRKINIHMRNELIISLAVCYGISFYQAVDFRHPAPFWGILGPINSAKNGDLLNVFSQFFGSLLTSQDIGHAVTPFNFLQDGSNYILITAELLFNKLKELALETPMDYSHLNREARRKRQKDPEHPLSGEKYWQNQKKKFLMKK